MPVIFIATAASTAVAQKQLDAPVPVPTCARTITADVVAFDQIIFYNRFGSFDPAGMMYALRRDVVPITGTEIGPGNTQLRPDKRARPIVLRVNQGDCLQVTFTNMLTPDRTDVEDLQFVNMPDRRPYWDKPPFFGQVIRQPDGSVRLIIAWFGKVKVFEFHLGTLALDLIDDGDVQLEEEDTPATRVASMHVNGLDYMPTGGAGIASDGANIGLNPSSLAAPGQTKVYTWYAAKQGQYLIHSMGAPSGGEGDGGQPAHGLFGSVNVEPAESKWYRSQVTAEVLNAVKDAMPTPIGQPKISDYDKTDQNGDPILNMLKGTEIIYTDLNAIISNFEATADGCISGGVRIDPPSGTCGKWFREFTVLFHDELESGKPAFPELHADEPVFHSIRDAFGINYGSSGLGAILLANRKKVGPSKDCPECSFEEFFLSSHPNGDPALLVRVDPITDIAVEALFPDDPANVHHSYLGDPVRFRNIHMGPKETHVFHLHAHQWLATPRGENSTYLDSQTISPGAAFTYEINYGGGGNRNFTPGDAIFHCHLYPHLAQGMWELWRNHDVWEVGTVDRNVPDGEIAAGVPTPAVIPIPDRPMPLMPNAIFKGYPFYIEANKGHRAPQPPLSLESDGGLPRHQVLSGTTVHGLAAIPAFRQADMVFQRVRSMNNDPNLVNFAHRLETANIQLLPEHGTVDEQTAMRFHQGTLPGGQAVPRTIYDWPARGYPTFTPSGGGDVFLVNGRIPPAGQVAQPGAPFADPCSDSFLNDNNVRVPVPLRRYRAAWIQFAPDGPPFDMRATLEVNKARWHDRQARATVLERDVLPTLNGTRPAEPLFFRARSGDCIDYRVTNLVPGALNLDDFQVYQGTDTIGQHIHLVKFDVTSSDGAANGFNYENGAFSPEEVRDRIEANNLYQQQHGGTQILTAQTNPTFGAGLNNEWVGAQTMIERWWADTLVNREGKDRTLRTIFTHDHMSPSGHQHQGMYAGLIAEPQGSTWTSLDGSTVFGTRLDGGPTSFASNILAGPSNTQSFREFGLNIADFAIVYTPRDEGNIPVNPPNRVEHAPPFIVGSPDIDNPERFPFPEATSAADPGTQLINYRQEPIPLRIGHKVGGQFQQKPGDAGNLAFAFSSVIHGDPFTPLLKAYPGDRIQIRLLQGAQEEQHVINIHGHRWFSEPGTPFSGMDNNSGLTNSQAIGISEHFEFDFTDRVLPIFVKVKDKHKDKHVADYLYQSAPADNLWDGQWGILRAFRFTQADLARLPAGLRLPAGAVHSSLRPSFDAPSRILNAATTIGGETALPVTPFAEAPPPGALPPAPPTPGEEIADFDPAATTNPDDPDPELHELIAGEDAATVSRAQIQLSSGGSQGINSCANFPGLGTPPIKKFIIEAWLASTLLSNPNGIIYNPRFDFKDPAGIVFINADDRQAIRNGIKPLEPLVIRVNKGDCVEVRLRNRLPDQLPEYDSFNHMPPIIPRFNFNQINTSNRVSLHPQVLGYDVSGSDGSMVGYNPNTTVRPHHSIRYAWYAGKVSSNGQSIVLTPAELGVTHLRDVGDVIKHASHGLIGALVVEPEGAQYKHPVTGATLLSGADANIVSSSNQQLFREFVTHYQDDVTMQDADGTIPFEGEVFANTGMRNIGDTDDSEDSGQKAFNYKHEPLWARFGLPPETDQGTMNEQTYTDILSSKASHAECTITPGNPCDPATPIFTVQVGTSVRFRVLEAAGHPRQHGFTVFGHHWQFAPWTQNSTTQGTNPLTFEIGSYSGIGPTRHLNILTQAGGLTRVTGDFLYRTQQSFTFTGGLWGIFRVN